MAEKDLTEIAASLSIFKDVSRSTLDEIRRELRHEYWAPGDLLFSQGEEATHLYVVLQGEVAISAHDNVDSASEVSIVTRRAGELVGEQAFLGGGFRTEAAKCTTGGRALKISRTGVQRLLSDLSFLLNLATALSGKLADATSSRAFHNRNERLLFGEFRAHVSPEIAQALLNRGRDYGVPQRSRAVVLFSDIRGFTETAASIDPTSLATDVTRYFDHVVEVVHRFGGMVDKFLGDAVMAVWGDFLSDNVAMAERAVLCALELVATAARFRIGGATVRVGVGVNSGEVFVGNLGSEGKKQFTVLGAAVNLAARLESESKSLGVPIVIGETVHSGLTAEMRRKFQYLEREIRGAGNQTVFAGPIDCGGEGQ